MTTADAAVALSGAALAISVVNVVLAWPRTKVAIKKLEAWEERDAVHRQEEAE